MIPIKIRIKNFLSYPNEIQTINFKDYPLICLSGKNGHGKSALLDAMTWALWGQARKTSGTIRADVGLIRLGQTQMMVSLEFEFSGNIYRVRREYAKTFGKPVVILDFEILDKQKDRFLPLTEKTIKLTEKKIESLLGLDFETFSNSAFLRQGQSNEFSKKTPKERKQILANILGLSMYDQLQALALERLKKLDSDKKVLLGILQKSNEEIEKQGDIEKTQKKEQEKIKKINLLLNKQEKKLLILEKRKNVKDENRKIYMSMIKDIEDLKKSYNEKLNKFKLLSSQWRKSFHKSLHVHSMYAAEVMKDKLIKENKNLLSIQQKRLDLQASLLKKKEIYQKESIECSAKLEREIYSIKLDLEKELVIRTQAEKQLKCYEKNITEIERNIKFEEKELISLKNRINSKQNFSEELKKNKAQFDKRRTFYNALLQRANWLKIHINELKQKSGTLKKNKSPSCPLCQQVLTIKRKQFLLSRFNIEDSLYIHKMTRVSILIDRLKSILFEQNEKIKNLQKHDSERDKLLVKKREIEISLDGLKKELKKNGDDIYNLDLKIKESILKEKIKNNVLNERISEFDQKFKANKFLNKIENEIKKLEYQFNNLKYDRALHLKVQKDLQKIDGILEEHKRLKENLIQQNKKRSEVYILYTQLKGLKNRIVVSESKRKKLKVDENEEKALLEEIASLKKAITSLVSDKDVSLQNIGKIQNELDRIKRLKKENVLRKNEARDLSEESKYYQFLAKAFSRDGIQALLIEQSIPEIEHEANKILSRLTDNQSQVFFESLRDLKKGGVKETLDIQISDSIGMRPYEMFSGGEAFRVDFAIRIAISKLLSRRSGAALQTLIIDEGFGSQDEDGLNRLMDAIHAIQHDFAKIIVVSHLSVFRDNFPIHFIVNKNSSGSFVTIQERG